jgi:hypothetical protein
LLLIHFLGSWLVFFHLLLSLFFKLIHRNWWSWFFLFDFPLALPVIVIVLLVRFIPRFLLTFDSLIRKGFHVIIFIFVARIHDSNSFSIYFETRIISLSIGCWCLLRREELDEGKVFESTCKFVFNLSDIFNRRKGLKDI